MLYVYYLFCSIIKVHRAWYSSRTIVVDFRHSFTVINMNDRSVPIGQIHSFHSYV